MSDSYLGRLDHKDPLYEVLFYQLNLPIKEPSFHVERMHSQRVYKYIEEKTNIAIIGKFFDLNDRCEDKVRRIKGEFDNLLKIRNYGFDIYPLYVVKPFGKEEKIGLALTEEFIYGKDLDYYIKKAIYKGKEKSLKKRLSRLADFLYELHTKTKKQEGINVESLSIYFLRILDKLNKQDVIFDKKIYIKLMDKWLSRNDIQNVNASIVHGDATPTNFIFTQTNDIVAIDLERMKDCDPVYDIGMVCGELKHAFMWRKGKPQDAETYIRFFLKEYSKHFKDKKMAFKEITYRNPFYMGLTELRIARNNYLSIDYKRWLAYEAMECLRWGLILK